MKIKYTIITLAVLIIAAFGVSRAVALSPQPAKPHIVKEKWHKPPKQVKKTIKFTPWAKPTVSQVFKIMAWEQERWGGPSLVNRIRCESTFRWYESYGQYMGLLQYGPPAWAAAWPHTPRKVVLVNKVVKKKPIVRFRKWSHLNNWIRKETNHIKQKVWIVKKGRLPKNATPYHGWAAIRAGQRAVSGHGPNTSWACGL